MTLVVLGNAQDGGYPHIGCTREDCRNLFLRPASNHHVVALGLVDAEAGEQFLFEATPDLRPRVPLERPHFPQSLEISSNHLIGVNVDDFLHIQWKQNIEEKDFVSPNDPLLLTLPS